MPVRVRPRAPVNRDVIKNLTRGKFFEIVAVLCECFLNCFLNLVLEGVSCMRLKPICASIMLLGLTMSGSAFAATHHHYVKKVVVQNQKVVIQDQLTAMQAQMNQMEQVINQNGGGTQSMGGTSLQSKLANSSDWYNAITVSGLINADGIYSNRTSTLAFSPTAQGPAGSTFGTGDSSDLVLTNADLFVDAQINCWTKAHVGLNYENVPVNIVKDGTTTVLDEAYVTIGNFCENPFYFRAGKQYVNFGNYDRFAAVPTFTQLLSQTNAPAATVGFVDQGFYGSIYGFRGLNRTNEFNPVTTFRPNTGSQNVNNAGANLGFQMQNNGSGFNLQASYLNNMADVDYVSESIVNGGLSSSQFFNNYVTRVGAMSLDATGNMGMFDAAAHYVSALGDFSRKDILANGSMTTGARPSAMTVGAGVTFGMMGYSSHFGLDYQHSWQAENVGLFGMPEARYEGTYNVNVSKNVNVGLDVFQDRRYDANHGGADQSATTGLLRLGVMFA